MEQIFMLIMLSVRSVRSFWNTRLAGEHTHTHTLTRILLVFVLSRLAMDRSVAQAIGINFKRI